MNNALTPQRAPSVTVEAIGHGRKIVIDAIGAPAVLIFAGRETSDAAPPIVDSIRAKYPMASQVVIANVADVRGIPRFVRKVAQTMMKSSYNKALDRLEPGKTPGEYVLILPDWDGTVMTPLGIDDVSKSVAIAVIDAKGNVVGTYQGIDAAARALSLLDQARDAH
ncbi:MAG: hypothetical protein M3P30_14625 [Chloroflexota bacterium]|nr:hypothetical protein [Chloroflexota bacterium]